MVNTSTKQLLKALEEKLGEDFPPHHWNHLRVWSAYWELKDRVSGKK